MFQTDSPFPETAFSSWVVEKEKEKKKINTVLPCKFFCFFVLIIAIVSLILQHLVYLISVETVANGTLIREQPSYNKTSQFS